MSMCMCFLCSLFLTQFGGQDDHHFLLQPSEGRARWSWLIYSPVCFSVMVLELSSYLKRKREGDWNSQGGLPGGGGPVL